MMNIIKAFQFEKILIGGLGACIMFYKKQIYINFIFNKLTQIISMIFIFLISSPKVVYLFFLPYYHVFAPIFESILLLIIILNISQNKNSLIKIKSSILHNLGKISYGIYMYHVVLILFVLKIIKELHINSQVVSNLVLYFSVIALTIIISKISYNYIEKPFLLIKDRIK